MTADTITLRPACPGDVEPVAELLAQLYRAELPGALRSPPADQARLFQHLVGHELAGGSGRYVAVEAGGQVLGCASLRGPGHTPEATVPPDIIQMALATIGPGDTLRMLLSALRAALSADVSLRPGECYIYSVVVRDSARRRGVGADMMAQLEAEARQIGARAALLRVVVGNDPARRLYARLGYQLVSRTPPLLDWLGVPTELMRKELG